MNIYEEYSKTKQQIAILQSKLEELEQPILEEIKGLSAPMRTEYGLFTTTTRTNYKLSEKAIEEQKVLKDKIKEIEVKDIESGKAEKTETVSLRYQVNK